jgi:flagellar hook-basal body complex protein FliE
MSLIGSVSSFYQAQTPAKLELGKFGQLPGMDQLGKADGIQMPNVAGAAGVRATDAPQAVGTPSFGAILENVVGDVNSKMEAGAAEQAKVLSGESTNLHQAMISMQEASVAFSLMVEVRNKLVESYQELMRMQV